MKPSFAGSRRAAFAAATSPAAKPSVGASIVRAAILLGALLFVLPTGCSLFGSAIQVDLLLPPVPPRWEPVFRAEGGAAYLLRAPGRGREIQEWVVSPPGDSNRPACRIALPKRANTPVLAFPVVQGRSDLLKPAGAIFPVDLAESGRLRLSYREGFVALLLSRLVERGQLVEALNVERLSAEIEARSEGDPWLVDSAAIASLLSCGSFRADRIKRLPTYALGLRCAASSRWIGSDPFRPEAEADDLGTLTLEGVVPGFHALFRVADGSAGGNAAPAGDAIGALTPVALERIDLLVGDEEWYSCNTVTGDAEYGRW